MITKNNFMTFRFWNAGVVAALAAVCALTLISVRAVNGQTQELQIVPLSQGYSPDRHVNLEARGPSDVLQSLLAGVYWK